MNGKFVEKYYSDGIIQFEGMYENGKPNGFGKSYHPNGKLEYEGTWLNGLYNGKGILYNQDGIEIYSGEWINGHQLSGNQQNNYDSDVELEGIEQYISELNSLIGLMNVKKELNSLINFVRLQKIRRTRGLKTPAISLHMVFVGNPGTGKTTVARLISKIYFKLGYLTKGHVVETGRSGLVAEYLGQTAIKTEETVMKAVGGVLFIDEAYSLVNGLEGDYGKEAIDTLLKLMEDYRDNLVVVVAGYPELMKKFIASNPGLKSRFNRYITFDDYNERELYQIFEYICDKNSYKIDELGSQELQRYINKLIADKDENFGNARTIRNIFEHTIIFQANRIINLPTLPEDLSCLTKADIIRYINENH